MTRPATCRICGARGYEDADDAAPGVCPPCLDRRMNEATDAFGDAVARLGLTVALPLGHAWLVWAGLTPEAADAFLADALAMAHAAEDV